MSGDLIWTHEIKTGRGRVHDGPRITTHNRESDEFIDRLRVNREPCTFCGVRADVGCRHRGAA